MTTLTGSAEAPSDPSGAAVDHRDVAFRASAKTTAESGITDWRVRRWSGGQQELLGTAAGKPRYLAEIPPYDQHTAGSMMVTVHDEAGHATRGSLTMLDGEVIASNLPDRAGTLAQEMNDDMNAAPTTYDWSACNAAQQVAALSENSLSWYQTGVRAAGFAVDAACFTPAIVQPEVCAAAVAGLALAMAAEKSAEAAAVSAEQAAHAACDNLCTSNDWCVAKYGNGLCNADGTCAFAQSTICFSCQAVTCGWDYTCGEPAYCGPCGGGGGGGEDPTGCGFDPEFCIDEP